MQFAKASRFADDHDVVLVGYRGVDGSSVLDCPEVESALKHSADFLGAKSMRAYGDAFRACADRLQADGVDLAGYTLPQRVDDLEAARARSATTASTSLSESAGTRTAMIYAWRYPKSIHRSVMIGVNPPGHFLWDPKTTDAQIRRYSALCAKDDALQRADGRPRRIMRRTDATSPTAGGSCRSSGATCGSPRFFGLMESTSEAAPISAPDDDRLVALGRERRRERALVPVAARRHRLPRAVRLGRGRRRRPARRARPPTRYFAAGADRGSILGNPGTDFIWAGGGLADAWPRQPGRRPVQPRADVERRDAR